MDTLDIEEPAVVAVHPWRTMWFSPRRTIRAIVDSSAPPSWVPVFALACLHQVAGAVQRDPLTGSIDTSLSTMPVIVGLLQLIFGIVVGPFLIAIVGGWFGGEGDPADIRPAVAWGYVPFAVLGFVWIPIFALTSGVSLDGSENTAKVLGAGALGLVLLASLAWSFVLQVAAIAEVHRYSIWRSLATQVVFIAALMLLRLLRVT